MSGNEIDVLSAWPFGRFKVTQSNSTMMAVSGQLGEPEAPKVRWRQANGNWFVVDEIDGEVYASAIRDDHGLWEFHGDLYASGLFWTENAARLAIQDDPEFEGMEFVNPVVPERA